VLPAVILAAGASTRMGEPKALLPASDGRLFVVRIAHALLAAGLDDIVIVTGNDHDAIAAAVDDGRLRVRPRLARNPDPARGQLSSLWTGMDAALTTRSEGLMMTLVDVPMVNVSTILRVIETWRRTRAPIVRPAIGDRHGHPVIFDRALFRALREAPLEGGAKTVVRAHEPQLVNVLVDDEGCLVDVDTREDYEALRKR
jgi:molybdenum cofactor cytidylyltransferase